MARVRSTARVSREGEETEVTETTPISEVMERSGLVVTEGAIDEGAPDAEAEQTVVEEENVDESEDYSILIPTKPSHLDFEKSTVSEDDMPMMMKLGYFGEVKANLFNSLEKKLPQCRRRMKLWFSRASSEWGCNFP